MPCRERMALKSPLSAERVLAFLNRQLDLEWCLEDLEVFLWHLVRRRDAYLGKAYRLKPSFLDFRTCHLLRMEPGKETEGVAIDLLNKPDGIHFFLIRDLGGGDRCVPDCA